MSPPGRDPVGVRYELRCIERRQPRQLTFGQLETALQYFTLVDQFLQTIAQRYDFLADRFFLQIEGFMLTLDLDA